MKNIYNFFCLFALGFFTQNLSANSNSLSEAKELMQNSGSGFLENKGQMTDMNNNPVPFVLFKTEAPGMNMFILPHI